MRYLTTIVLLFILFGSLTAQKEEWYIEEINKVLKGKTEVNITGGRADIVTKTHAIEVEFAKNWKQSIGQSLWYGLNLNKKPGIIIILLSNDDFKYVQMLQSSLDYAGISDKIDVKMYPQDYDLTYKDVENRYELYRTTTEKILGHYSINENSDKRHNKNCAYYDCKNCRPAGPNEGEACKICGG